MTNVSKINNDREARIQERYERLFNNYDLLAADELATDSFIDHSAPPNNPVGPEGVRSVVVMLHTAFPDIHYTVNDVVVAGDKMVMWTTVTGTHRGTFLGAPPTGRSFKVDQMHLLRLDGDRIAEHRAVRDDLGMMVQLGLVTPPGMLAGRGTERND